MLAVMLRLFAKRQRVKHAGVLLFCSPVVWNNQENKYERPLKSKQQLGAKLKHEFPTFYDAEPWRMKLHTGLIAIHFLLIQIMRAIFFSLVINVYCMRL